MEQARNVYLSIDRNHYDLARRIIDEAAGHHALKIRTKSMRGCQLRQLELADASLALAISLAGSIAAPSVISFISEIASRFRGKHHSIAISAELAETIGKEVVTRYSEPGPKARLMSLEELNKGKGFKLLFRQREKTYTIRLSQYGELEACTRH